MRANAHGFTLIELMIVVAIIALLAAIALPAYNQYRIRSAEAACQAEAKNYASFSLAALYNDAAPDVPVAAACQSITMAVDMATPVVGTPRSPGLRTTTCDMSSATCVMN